MKHISLTQGRFALVDDRDYEWLNQWKWHTQESNGTYYAKRYRNIAMHRLVIKATSKKQVDHINHNGLDNRRCNLRICNNSQNHQNGRIKKHSSKYKGVRAITRKYKNNHTYWYAQIGQNNKVIYLGCYKTEIEAAKVYDKEAKKLFGKFANLNFN